LYFEPLARNIETFLDSASLPVEGKVKIKLHKGNLTIISLQSKYSLFNYKLGTYGEEANKWSGQDAKGFCAIYGTESINSYLIQKNIWQKKIS
jgi:argininosuccinate synthase